MNSTLTHDDEQEALQEAVRRFLAEKSPSTEVRRLMETAEGYDPAVWAQMAEQLGLQGLVIPERFGGSGATFAELAVVLEEMGGALLCAPFFSTVVLAANAILSADDEDACRELLPGIARGETIATVAFVGDDDRWGEGGVGIDVAIADGEHRLTGTRSFVLDGHIADLIVVVGETEAGPTLFAVGGDAPGLERRQLETLDPTRKQARLTFAATPARRIGAPGAGWTALSTTLDLAAAGLAAEAAGGAQRCLDMAAEYARTRVQFGRVIGSFQAIKHLCADMLVEVEGAKAAAYHAAWAASDPAQGLTAPASLAKTYCCEVFRDVAAENIQVHGGIGYTWEHDAHLYLRRAKSSELLLGGDRARRLLESHIGL